MWGSLRLWVERGLCGCRGIAGHTVHRARAACNVQSPIAVPRATQCDACWGETLCAVQALVALLEPRASAGALRSRGMQVAQAHRGHGKCVYVLRVLAEYSACRLRLRSRTTQLLEFPQPTHATHRLTTESAEDARKSAGGLS